MGEEPCRTSASAVSFLRRSNSVFRRAACVFQLFTSDARCVSERSSVFAINCAFAKTLRVCPGPFGASAAAPPAFPKMFTELHAFPSTRYVLNCFVRRIARRLRSSTFAPLSFSLRAMSFAASSCRGRDVLSSAPFVLRRRIVLAIAIIGPPRRVSARARASAPGSRFTAKEPSIAAVICSRSAAHGLQSSSTTPVTASSSDEPFGGGSAARGAPPGGSLGRASSADWSMLFCSAQLRSASSVSVSFCVAKSFSSRMSERSLSMLIHRF